MTTDRIKWVLIENQWAGKSEPNYWVQREGYDEREASADLGAAPEARYGVHLEEDGENLIEVLNRHDGLLACAEKAEELACAVAAYFNKRGVKHSERKGNEDIAAMADALSDYGYAVNLANKE
jgi:hypothetical protein